MTEYGALIQEITKVLGPVKRRRVFEEWHDRNQQITHIVPRYSHLTLHGVVSRTRLCTLDPVFGHVESHPVGWKPWW